jgi:hypothetical protein
MKEKTAHTNEAVVIWFGLILHFARRTAAGNVSLYIQSKSQFSETADLFA